MIIIRHTLVRFGWKLHEPNRRDLLKGIGAGTAVAVGGAGVAAAEPPSEGDTIVDVAVAADGFDSLVAAVKRAGLVDTLDGNRQLTVLAPTDEAFADLLDALGLDSLKNVPVDTLRSILLYHVVPGRREAASVVDADQLPTLNGTEIAVDGTTLNEDGQFPATTVQTNIGASNGVIHVIDGVLNPVNQAGDDDEDEEDEERED